MKKDTNRDAGFTLVEFLIVIIILGILVTVTVFAVNGITDRGEPSGEAATTADINNFSWTNHTKVEITMRSGAEVNASYRVQSNEIDRISAVEVYLKHCDVSGWTIEAVGGNLANQRQQVNDAISAENTFVTFINGGPDVRITFESVTPLREAVENDYVRPVMRAVHDAACLTGS